MFAQLSSTPHRFGYELEKQLSSFMHEKRDRVDNLSGVAITVIRMFTFLRKAITPISRMPSST